MFRALKGEHKDLSEEQRIAFESVSESQRIIITELMMEIEGLKKRKERYDARTTCNERFEYRAAGKVGIRRS